MTVTMQRMFAKVQEKLDRERSSYLYVQDRRPASRTVVGPLPPCENTSALR